MPRPIGQAPPGIPTATVAAPHAPIQQPLQPPIPEPFAHPVPVFPAASRTGGGALSSVEHIVLKGIEIGIDGRSAPFEFDLPPDAKSFAMYLQGEETSFHLVDHLRAPSGDVWVESTPSTNPDNLFSDHQVRSKVRSDVGFRAGHNSLLVPNGEGVEVSGGKYAASLRAFAANSTDLKPGSGKVDVTIAVKRVSGTPIAGRVPLHIYVPRFDQAVPGKLSASTAANDPIINGGLEHLKLLLGEAGIEISDIQFHPLDVTAEWTTTLEGGQALLQKMTHKKGVGIVLLNLIDIDANGMSDASGMSFGLPGAPADLNVSRSGICMAMRQMMIPREFGEVLAHELGHYFGLFHTADDFLNIEDTFDDTTHRGDAGNIMFPFDRFGPLPSKFSRAQARLLLLHPDIEVTRTRA